MSHHLIEFRNVSFRYPDGTDALMGIDFRIIHGESVGVIGANGAGKSTLLQHMNGCLMPTAGSTARESEHRRAARAASAQRSWLPAR